MIYEEAKELLQSQGKFYINLGLERIEKVLAIYDNPHRNAKIIHIAGTNGKGSVASTIANILKYAGYKTGLYTSPHLVEYTERIKINGTDISQEDFARYISSICETAEKNQIDLTEFEILTAAAFKYFSDNKVDYIVLETGLGGRFDATNICEKSLAIITSISLDHIDRLGDTYEKIAFEKAGIIKENSTVITAQNNNGYKVIKKIAELKKAKLISVDYEISMSYEGETNYAIIDNEKYEFPLLGLYQKQNLALVIAAIKHLNIDKSVLKEGLKTTKWNARLEYIKEKNILIDGAHNPDSAIELKKSLDFYFKDKKKIFIYSTIDTKDYKTIAKTLFQENDEIYYIEFNHKNAVKYEIYKGNVPWLKNLKKVENLDELLTKKELKIITGSLYMIGEIYTKIREER